MLLLVASILCTPSAAVVTRHRIIVSDLKPDSVTAETASTLTGVLAEALARHSHVAVRDKQDLMALLTAERERQILSDCDGDSCELDLSKAAGAESVVTGKIGRLGSELVITASRIDTASGTVAQRAMARASNLESLSRELVPLAGQLLKGVSIPGLLGATEKMTRDGKVIGQLSSHDDCHWAAIRAARNPTNQSGPRPVHVATFPSTHFRFGKHHKLDDVLEIDRDLHFIGPFHSCFPRVKNSLDAFTARDEGSLLLKGNRAQVARLRDAWDSRLLELTVRFEIVGGTLHPSRAYDWENCEGENVAPFKPSDISPNAEIRVLSAHLSHTQRDKIYPVLRSDPDDPTNFGTLEAYELSNSP